MLYLQFNRKQWINFCNFFSLNPINNEILELEKMNYNLSLKEMLEIYIPLSRLLNLHINVNSNCKMIKNFIKDRKAKKSHTTYIIGITGGVSVGKSTMAKILQKLLSFQSNKRIVELITTDGFLHSNEILEKKRLMKKKGFPESYDTYKLIDCILKIKFGKSKVIVPMYSHEIYDIIPNQKKIIFQPDVLILEGLNILQSKEILRSNSLHRFLISDLVDFSIYIDAPEKFLRNWYIDRFLKFRRNAFTNPNSYFYKYSYFSEKQTIDIADQIWKDVNQRNLKENIVPTRKQAKIILNKNKNHTIKKIKIRRKDIKIKYYFT